MHNLFRLTGAAVCHPRRMARTASRAKPYAGRSIVVEKQRSLTLLSRAKEVLYIQSIRMRNLRISQAVLEKLRDKHDVTEREVDQCFENIEGPLLIDDREDHRSDPPTLWFISRTNKNRLLKIAYIQRGSIINLRTCYEPNEEEISIYSKFVN